MTEKLEDADLVLHEAIDLDQVLLLRIEAELLDADPERASSLSDLMGVIVKSGELLRKARKMIKEPVA